MEAVGHAGICLGILANDGIVMAAERRNTNKLLDDVFASEKIYKLHELVVFFLFILKMGCQNFLLMLIDAVVEFYSIASKLMQFQQGNFLKSSACSIIL